MKRLAETLNFLSKIRRSGTTTLIIKTAKESDCYVVVRNADEIKRQYREIADKCIRLEDFDSIGKTLPRKPVIFDTHVLRDLFESIKERFEQLENPKHSKEQLMQKITNSLRDIENTVSLLGKIN